MDGIVNYWGFVLAGMILNVTPGVDSIFILTRSIAQGRKAGYYSVFGIITGALCHTFLAAFGLSVLLMKSVVLFQVIKTIGAGYLIYLGYKTFIDRSNIMQPKNIDIETVDYRKIFRQGFMSNILNPKVALFFLSIIPQFIKPEFANGPIPFLVLGFTFVTTGTLWCLFLAYSASFITKSLRNNDALSSRLQKASGLVFVTLGLQILLK